MGPIGRDPTLDGALVVAIRDAVSDAIDIMIDAGQQWDRKGALRMADVWSDQGVLWLEEPLFADEIAGYRELTSRTPVCIAAGEQESSMRGFEELLDDGRIDILQPDLARFGGLTIGRRIAQLVADRHRSIVPHAFKTGVLVAVTAHFVVAIHNGDFMEHMVSESLLSQKLVRTPSEYADGFVTLPVNAAGLGIELDPDVL